MPKVHVALVLLLLAGSLAGCSDSPAAADVPTDDVVVDADGNAVADEAPSTDVVQTPVGAVAANKGIVVGRVRDAGNFSVSGAAVALLGTELHTKTSEKGTFRLVNATPGAFDLRVEAAGFSAQEVRVQIVAGKEVAVEVILEPKGDPNMAPHIHDYWGDLQEWTLMDQLVPMPDRVKPGKFAQEDLLRGNNNNRWPFILPEQEQAKPATIWPGTKELRFTLSWGSEPENDMPNAVVLVLPPGAEAPIELPPVTASGETTTYALTSSNQTDLGHGETTRWQFWVNIKNSPTTSTTAYQPTLAMDGIHVKLVIVKGELVLEAAHRDFWQGRDVVPIGDHARPCAPNTGVPPQPSDRTDGAPSYWVCTIHVNPDDEEAVNIIPPGTHKIQVEFTWTHPQGPLPFTYHLTYRTTAMSPAHTPASEYREPKEVEAAGNRILYEIELKPGDADGFYQSRSEWGFKWHLDDNPGYQTGYVVRFGLKVTAFRDPAYV